MSWCFLRTPKGSYDALLLCMGFRYAPIWCVNMKLDCLQAAIDVNFWHYNYMRKHSSIGTTPAIKAGIVDRVQTWSVVINEPAFNSLAA